METKEVKKVTQNGGLEIMNGINDAFEIVEQIKAEKDWPNSRQNRYYSGRDRHDRTGRDGGYGP